MATRVDPPVRTPYRYGLLSVAQIETQPELRLYSEYVFDSVACHQGIVWDINCTTPFVVTLTRTGVEDTFAVTVSAGVVGDYTISVNGDPAVALTDPVVITDPAPVTVVICEAAGFERCVTVTGIDPDSAEGTAYVFQSGQSSNLPKSVQEGISHPGADAFMVINGVSCTRIASNDLVQTARDAFLADEQRLVEQRYWAQLAASAPTILAVGAVSLVEGLALLEAFLRDNSGFTGVIHSDAYVSAYAAASTLIPNTNPETTKRTSLWTPWVFGGGYDITTGPAGEAAPGPGQAWMYATGQIIVHRGNIRVPGERDGGFNTTTNQDFVIAERPYVIINDCPIGAVLVDLEP